MRHDDDAMWEDFDRYAYEAQFDDEELENDEESA